MSICCCPCQRCDLNFNQNPDHSFITFCGKQIFRDLLKPPLKWRAWVYQRGPVCGLTIWHPSSTVTMPGAAFDQRRLNAGPTSATLVQHWAGVGKIDRASGITRLAFLEKLNKSKPSGTKCIDNCINRTRTGGWFHMPLKFHTETIKYDVLFLSSRTTCCIFNKTHWKIQYPTRRACSTLIGYICSSFWLFGIVYGIYIIMLHVKYKFAVI